MNKDLYDNQFDYSFNPNEIDISIKQISLYYLLRRLEQNEIDMFAGYQRHWNLWSETQQSRLIESLLIRIPIPAFYFDSGIDDKWQVVDGLQRVTTFYNFIVKENFTLVGLEFLPQFNGYRFSELPRELQRRIEEFSLTIYLLNSGTPDEIKFIIFSRINTGGINLNNQELRYALNQGVATRLLEELANSIEFREATFNSINKKRMDDFELVNRFLAFLIFGDEYRGNLEVFLNSTLSKLNHEHFVNYDIIKKDFIKAMVYSTEIFGEKRFKKNDVFQYRTRRINKALFETISVNLALLPTSKLENLLLNKEVVNTKMYLLLEDNFFNESISISTNSRKKVDYRFGKVRELFEKIIE